MPGKETGENEDWGRIETAQTTVFLRSTEILRSVLEIWENLLFLRPQWKTTSYNWWGKPGKIKARIDKSQKKKTNKKQKLLMYGFDMVSLHDIVDRDETTNHIIGECSKSAQKEYMTRNDFTGKVINWELCKRLKFDHTNKWHMHKPGSILKNEMHKLLCNFEKETDLLFSARRPDLIIINN